MLFNSFAFLIFFPAVCLIYFLLPHKYRWIFLLIASYYFYMNWNPMYALLIFASTFTTYLCGLLIEKYQENRQKKKLFLVLNLLFNFGVLFLFKYYNFINDSIFTLLEHFHIRWSVPNFDLLLPVGISFYTFQAVGYSIDVYRGDIKAEKNLGIYALFVSFFPQLVAGPIERTKNLLPQIRERHYFNSDRAVAGLKQMLWGFFMKVVVADRLSIYVDAVYNNVPNHNGTSLLIATFFFAIQIYCDFGGYSNIAIGAAKVMGFTLMENFRRPYFASSVAEFWKRWHISLSTWFRDYVYIPLGGNRVKQSRHLMNLFITFLVSGIWHGANWTFAAWGALHGLFLIIGVLKNKIMPSTFLGKGRKVYDIVVTSALAVFAWIFFRANSIEDVANIIQKIFTDVNRMPFLDKTTLVYGLFGITILFVKEFIEEYMPNRLYRLSSNHFIQYASALCLVFIILLFGIFNGGQFIYFQF